MTETPKYVVHVLQAARRPHLTEERTFEAKDLDDALDAVKEAVEMLGREWQAITIVHSEDFPKLMVGARYMGTGKLDETPDEP